MGGSSINFEQTISFHSLHAHHSLHFIPFHRPQHNFSCGNLHACSCQCILGCSDNTIAFVMKSQLSFIRVHFWHTIIFQKHNHSRKQTRLSAHSSMNKVNNTNRVPHKANKVIISDENFLVTIARPVCVFCLV